MQDAGSSMKGLVTFAEEHVPLDHRNSTLLALSATAGLRMLSEQAKNAILDSCFSWLMKNSPFIIRRDLISVISGKEGPIFHDNCRKLDALTPCCNVSAAEGAFGWLSINFLHGTLARAARAPPRETIHTLTCRSSERDGKCQGGNHRGHRGRRRLLAGAQRIAPPPRPHPPPIHTPTTPSPALPASPR